MGVYGKDYAYRSYYFHNNLYLYLNKSFMKRTEHKETIAFSKNVEKEYRNVSEYLFERCDSIEMSYLVSGMINRRMNQVIVEYKTEKEINILKSIIKKSI
jgi:hypothetical protein